MVSSQILNLLHIYDEENAKRRIEDELVKRSTVQGIYGLTREVGLIVFLLDHFKQIPPNAYVLLSTLPQWKRLSTASIPETKSSRLNL